MKNMGLLQIIRGMDGILFAVSLIILCIIHPSIGKDELGQLDILCVLPVLVISWASLRLPSEFREVEKWEALILDLRFFSCSFACLSPFVIWWLPNPNQPYLFTNALLAFVCGLGLLYHLASIVSALAGFSGNRELQWESRITRMIIFYLFLVPFLALLVSVIIDSYITSVPTFNGVYFILSQNLKWINFLCGLPILLCMSLVFRLRITLNRQLIAD